MAVTDDGSQMPAIALMGSNRHTGVEMHCDELMSPDLLSEIVLLVCGAVIFVSLLLFAITVLSSA